jgi:hypothetical protein
MRYRQPYYAQFVYIKAIIQILLDSILYVLNICTILTALWKRPQWYKLTKNLKTVQNNNNIVEKSDRFLFVFYNLIYWGYQIYMTLIFYEIMGVEFLKQFAIEYLQLYGQFIINFTFYVFSKMVLVRYRSLRKSLESQVRLVRKLSSRTIVYSLDHLNRIKYDIYLLKESVDIINNLFGWPVLLTIMFSGLQMLVYMQGIVVGAFNTFDTIIYTVMVMLWHCVSLSQPTTQISHFLLGDHFEQHLSLRFRVQRGQQDSICGVQLGQTLSRRRSQRPHRVHRRGQRQLPYFLRRKIFRHQQIHDFRDFRRHHHISHRHDPVRV